LILPKQYQGGDDKMKLLSVIALVAGVASLAAGLVLRLAVKEAVLGLAPSSFLEFSMAAFLLTLALEAVGRK